MAKHLWWSVFLSKVEGCFLWIMKKFSDLLSRSSRSLMFCIKLTWKLLHCSLGKHLWRSLFYNQLFCKFCKILRSTFTTEHFPVTASVFSCRARVKRCLQRFLCFQEHIKLFSILIWFAPSFTEKPSSEGFL